MTDPHPIIPASDTAAIPSMLATALVYAERGWPVVPLHTVDPGGTCSCSSEKQCENPGKHPMTLHGYKDATRDPEEIKRWWTAHPTANIGIPTGAISGFDVLDVDTRSDGDESLADLESKLGRIPDTVESLTGGGGRHIFFQHHPGLRNMTAARMGIDIRAGGGYIVVPPSRHASGRRYHWELSSLPEEVEIKPWPTDLFKALCPGAAGPDPTADLSSIEHAQKPPHPLSESPNSVQLEIQPATGTPQLIPHGTRNTTLASLAGTMRKRGMTEGAIAAALLADNRERCKPPLEDREVIRIAKSIAKYAPDEIASNFVSSVPISINGTSETNIDLKPISAYQLITEAPETKWQIDGILPTGSAMVVVADAGVGKTWLMHDLAVAIDQDRKWIGHFSVSQGKVLIIDEENAIALIKKRLQKLLKGHDLPEDGSELKVQFLAATGMNLSSEAYVAELQTVLETMRPDLVIIDALVRIHTNNENDAGEMASLFGIFKRWINEYGCSFVFCHHQRKPGPIGNAPSTMYRGSSEIRAFVDTHLDLRKLKSQEGVFTVDHVKSRYAEPVAPFDVEICDVGEDAIQLRHLGDSSARIEDKLDKATEFIQSLMEDGQWHSRQEIEEKGKTHSITRDMLDKARTSMVKSGELEETQEGKKKVFRSAKLRSDAPSLYIGTEETNQQQNLLDFSPTTDG